MPAPRDAFAGLAEMSDKRLLEMEREFAQHAKKHRAPKFGPAAPQRWQAIKEEIAKRNLVSKEDDHG